jgi:hypothetical protein
MTISTRKDRWRRILPQCSRSQDWATGLKMYEQEKLGRWQGKKHNNDKEFPSNSADTFR